MDIPHDIRVYLKDNPQVGREKIAGKFGISSQEARMYCREIKGRRDKNLISKGIAFGDEHYPDHDEPTINIIRKFTKDFKPDYFLRMGDMMDFGTISYHNRKKMRLVEGKRLKREYRAFQKRLDEIDATLPPDCETFYVLGNHEYRVDRLIEEQPQHEGFIELAHNLDMERYEVIPFNEVFNIGDMWFLHGEYYNKYHAEKNARIYGKHIFNWHVHTNQVYTMHSALDRAPRQGVSVGCTSNKNPSYLLNRPNAWVHQFLYFYLYDDGSFTYYTPIIIDGRCVINGKEYTG